MTKPKNSVAPLGTVMLKPWEVRALVHVRFGVDVKGFEYSHDSERYILSGKNKEFVLIAPNGAQSSEDYAGRWRTMRDVYAEVGRTIHPSSGVDNVSRIAYLGWEQPARRGGKRK